MRDVSVMDIFHNFGKIIAQNAQQICYDKVQNWFGITEVALKFNFMKKKIKQDEK